MEKRNYKPFKEYREMDDEQKQKISSNPNLHHPKSEETKRKISQTMKGRWAVAAVSKYISPLFSPASFSSIALKKGKSFLYLFSIEVLQNFVSNTLVLNSRSCRCDFCICEQLFCGFLVYAAAVHVKEHLVGKLSDC